MKQEICTNAYLNMSFRAYIICKLDKSKLKVWLQNSALGQNRMQGTQLSLKFIYPLNWEIN